MINSPLLITSPLALPVHGMDDLAAYLQLQYRIQTLEPVRSQLDTGPWSLRTASLFFGDVGVTSIAGSAMSVSLQPLLPLCMLALPSAGWGKYQVEDDSVECVQGQSLAYLPAHSWRLTNDCSGGTGVNVSEQALLARVLAMSASPAAERFLARLRQPRSIQLAAPQRSPGFPAVVVCPALGRADRAQQRWVAPSQSQPG